MPVPVSTDMSETTHGITPVSFGTYPHDGSDIWTTFVRGLQEHRRQFGPAIAISIHRPALALLARESPVEFQATPEDLRAVIFRVIPQFVGSQLTVIAENEIDHSMLVFDKPAWSVYPGKPARDPYAFGEQEGY